MGEESRLPSLEQVLEAAREQVARRVAEGYDPPELISGDVGDFMIDEFGERAGVREAIDRLTEELLESHRRAQEMWAIPTDCDRLDRAFAALERGGIVARQHFTCCQTCGHSEIADEVAAKGGAVKGYTFFDMQDTDSAARYGTLYLAFGAVGSGGPAAVEVGRLVCAELERAGLRPRWDGRVESRILVALEWKRRRPPLRRRLANL